jgi:hypothetical protein
MGKQPAKFLYRLDWRLQNIKVPWTYTFTERQCEFGQRTASRSLIPVIVPMYLKEKKYLVWLEFHSFLEQTVSRVVNAY